MRHLIAQYDMKEEIWKGWFSRVKVAGIGSGVFIFKIDCINLTMMSPNMSHT